MNFSNLYHATQSNLVLKRLRARVAAIAAHESGIQGLPLAQLRDRLDALRQAGASRQRAAWLAEVFALVRECSRQVLGLRQHDVQMLGGLVLAEGKLAEMRTGEGKTLTIAAPCVAAALAGQCVHVVTVNEYLAQRDADTLRPLYEACGLTVGVIKSGQSVAEKQAAYACDVVYGVNFEFGFDYLRDNQVLALDQRVQRTLGFVVVDEVDSVLIDEARTPLIISGMAEPTEAHERALDQAVRQLRQGEHFTVDEKERSASLNDTGYTALEQLLVAAGLVPSAKALYAVEHLQLLQRVNQALAAHFVYRRDKHYVVRDGEVVIIDEATGRLMAGRRWGEGLHEAVEAKEGLTIKPPTQTQATITYQNFFGLYQTLSGLTGTAVTEAEEFVEIYGLQTVVVPTHRPVARVDAADIVFPTAAQKFAAIVAEVAQRHARGQPVLVGTASVAESEHLSQLLQRAGIPHAVLNARQNAQEADVIAAAGMPGAVTVATNMAGRGTDVVLGGHPGTGSREDWQAARDAVVAAGGLHVIGADRHESRRVDNQLRGRAGRQGDVGSSQFFISLEDRLLRVYATDRNAALAKLVSQPDGVSHPLVDKVVALAQKRLERQGFQARLDLMKYDGALSAQRQALYALRNQLLAESPEELREHAQELGELAALEVSKEWLGGEWLDEASFDALGLKEALKESFDVSAPVLGWVHQEELEPAAMRERVGRLVAARAGEWLDTLAPEQARATLLQALDRQWVEHLTRLDELRAAISLRTMAQQNPVYAFTRDSKRMFEELKSAWAFAVMQDLKDRATFVAAMSGDNAATVALNGEQRVHLSLFQRHVTRNESCPCGSGQRFKACHGLLGR